MKDKDGGTVTATVEEPKTAEVSYAKLAEGIWISKDRREDKDANGYECHKYADDYLVIKDGKVKYYEHESGDKYVLNGEDNK